ncbi:hypothetical protein EDB92DRAFT_1927494, partial [Lactarius akahatsu]
MDKHSLTLQLLVPNLNLLAVCRISVPSALDEEVVFVLSAPWNIAKATYLFCRYYPLAVRAQHVCESYFHALSACTVPPLLFTLVSVVSSVLLMLRTYAFSGRKNGVLAVLSITFSALVGYMIWVSWKQIILSPLFLFVERTGCLGITDIPTIKIAQVTSGTPGISSVLPPFAYHLGALTSLFDGLNMFVMIWHCYRERRTLGSLAQSILKQGIFIYIFMTILNMLTFGTFFRWGIVKDYPDLDRLTRSCRSSRVLYQARAIGPWFAYILPSVLVIVLMLRRKASPTETQLRSQYSHIVDEALEMIAVESHPEETSKETALSVSRGAHAQP